MTLVVAGVMTVVVIVMVTVVVTVRSGRGSDNGMVSVEQDSTGECRRTVVTISEAK